MPRKYRNNGPDMSQRLKAMREVADSGIFAQECGWRRTSFGHALYVKFRRINEKPIGWTELWQQFSQRYPDKWAVQFFPPAEEVLDEAHVYHLFVLEEAPDGVNIRDGHIWS